MMKPPSRDRPSRDLKGAVARVIATWFGCGYAPIAPGTAGSLAALLIAIALHAYAGSGRATFLLLSALFLLPGIWAADVTAQRAGQPDPGMVVVDEVLGQWLALAGAATLNWKGFLAAFVLFRILDVWKPPPVRRLESLPGGIGIVADDLMAGLYSALAIFLLDRLQLL